MLLPHAFGRARAGLPCNLADRVAVACAGRDGKEYAMDYGSAMQQVGDLIQNRYLDDARSLLNSILHQYPNDERALLILQKIDEATGGQSEVGRPMAHRAEQRMVPIPRDQAWRPAPASSDPSRQLAEQKVKQAVSEVAMMDAVAIPADAPLAEFGLDSLDAIELTLVLEEYFDVVIDEDVAETMLADPENATVRRIADVMLRL